VYFNVPVVRRDGKIRAASLLTIWYHRRLALR